MACGCAVASWLVRIQRSSFEPRGPFLEGSEKFSHPQSRSKTSNFMTAELCYSRILIKNRVPFRSRIFRRIQLSVFKYRLTETRFSNLKLKFPRLSRNGPWQGTLCCVLGQGNVYSHFPARCTGGY